MYYGPEVMILLQITVMLVFALIFGGLVKRLHYPSVLGEILGGIILGPTLFGAIAPAIQSELFPVIGDSSHTLYTFAYLGLVAFVFIAGMEVDTTCIKYQGRTGIITSISGVILPFALGFGMVVLMPQLWSIPIGEITIFALFMGTALSISALPVIARILIDLDLLKTEVGGINYGGCNNKRYCWLVYLCSDYQRLKDEYQPGSKSGTDCRSSHRDDWYNLSDR
jgi:Kef-type K+ transport system membrane component KefB